MINRVLIRIKTVQLLYSYLLVQNPFSLESVPTPPTKEKRFAYDLYLDVLYLMYRISVLTEGPNRTRPLLKSRLITKMELTERFKTLKTKYQDNKYPFAVIEKELSEKVRGSLLFREYCHDEKEGRESDKIWENIFNAIILPDPQFNDILPTLPLYTLSGVERMKGLMEDTFRHFYSTRDNIEDALATLKKSLDKARELYMRLLSLPVELTRLRRDRLALNKKKILARTEDLNPNMRFVDNVLPSLIEGDSRYAEYVEKNKLSWFDEDRDFLERLLNDILSSEIYKEYMDAPSSDRKQDIEFWRKIFRDLILPNPDFLEYLENKSVFWNDDLEITSTFWFKTVRRLEDGVSEPVLPMFKDEEDASFGSELFRYVIDNRDLYRGYINKILESDKWEADRLAFMDVVIILTALAEILNFPKIPLLASINEYIEIAKSYSSNKSGAFVNGLLGSLVTMLKEDGILHK